MDCVRLSPHFTLDEFLNVRKYPDNKPSLQHVVNMTYGCLMLLEPARQVVGPIIINSATCKGCQIIIDSDEYKVKYPIYDKLAAARKEREGDQ